MSLRYWPCSSAIFLGGSSFPFSCIPYWCLPLLAVMTFFECTLCADAADLFTMVPYFLLYCLSDLQKSSSQILRGRYSLSMSLCGCIVRWAVMSFLVLRSRFSSSAIVQSTITMPAVYLITGTAQKLIAWIVFPPFSFDFSILHTLLVYSADVCFFTWQYLTSSACSTPRYL